MRGYDFSRHIHCNGKSLPILLDPDYRRGIPNSK